MVSWQEATATMAETLLAVDSLVKRFGAVTASDNFSMDVAR